MLIDTKHAREKKIITEKYDKEYTLNIFNQKAVSKSNSLEFVKQIICSFIDKEKSSIYKTEAITMEEKMHEDIVNIKATIEYMLIQYRRKHTRNIT